MKTLTRFLLLLFCLFSFSFLLAQGHHFKASLGNAYHFSAQANGYHLGLEYQHRIHSKASWGIEISQGFQHARGMLPNDITQARILLRDQTQPEPLGEGNSPFFWNDEAFPKIQLASKPDRFYQFSVAGKYLQEINKGNRGQLRIGLGLALSYRDEMELQRFIRTQQLKFTFPGTTIEEALIPLFVHRTFIDWTLVPEVTYQFSLGKALFLGFRGQLWYYPSSKDWILVTSLSISKALR